MIRKLRRKEFSSIYELMEQSFPLDEYRPYGEQEALLKNPRYTISVMEEPESGRLQAFLTIYTFDDFFFVEHFAVSTEVRGQGIGSQMLSELKEELPKRLCLEVELPETVQAQKRIAFYERNGFSLNEYPYVQPPISAGRQPLPLRLMTTGGRLTKEEFQQYQKMIMREVYHAEGFELPEK